jgi:L-alanine-DL-glutamate epimerase-like enolase superfamily enzyme
MEVADVEVLVLQAPSHDPEACDPAYETAVVRLTTDTGLEGLGEGLANPWAVRAFIENPASGELGWIWGRSLKDLVIGRDPRDPAAIWQDLLRGTLWSGRVGIGHVAIGAIDMALWDIAGRAAGEPVWKLLNPDGGRSPRAYITVYYGPGSVSQTIESQLDALRTAKQLGFTAGKLEAQPEAIDSDEGILELVGAARDELGPEFSLLCDMGYRWQSAEQAIAGCRPLEPYDLFLIEAPLAPDDLSAHAQLVDAVSTPIAGAEILYSKAEFINLLDFGQVAIAQPATVRLGITATDALTREAHVRGKRVVPYGWVGTTIGMAANVHLGCAHENVPLVEYTPPSVYPTFDGFELRRSFAAPEPEVGGGRFLPPEEPGLGVAIVEATSDRYVVSQPSTGKTAR